MEKEYEYNPKTAGYLRVDINEGPSWHLEVQHIGTESSTWKEQEDCINELYKLVFDFLEKKKKKSK